VIKTKVAYWFISFVFAFYSMRHRLVMSG